MQQFTNVWGASKIDAHRKAAAILDEAVALAWDYIAAHLKKGELISEYNVQQFIQSESKSCTA